MPAEQPSSPDVPFEALEALEGGASSNGQGTAAELYLVSACMYDIEGIHWPEARWLPVDAFHNPEARSVWRAMLDGLVFSKDESAFEKKTGLPKSRLISIEGLAGSGTGFRGWLNEVESSWRADEYQRIASEMVRNPHTSPTSIVSRLQTLINPSRLASAFTVWQPAAFRAWDPPTKINLLGGGYLRRRQLTTLIGPPGVGKSRLSLWLACSHICNRSFFGLECQNGPMKWLFFGNENDPLRQKTDLSWFYKRLRADEQALVDANLFLHVIDRPDDGIITLADPDAFAKLNATLAHYKPDVVVFDPWGNMIEGNENDNEEVRRTLKLLLRAIATNCMDAATLVIHHARTGRATAIEAGNNFSGGSLGRGSKALVSAARCELALWPGHSEDSDRLVLTCEKVNNVQKFEPMGLRFENGCYEADPDFTLSAWRDDIEGVRSGKTLTINDIVAMVQAGVCKAQDIADRAKEDFGIGRSTVMLRLREACKGGYLERTIPAGSYILGTKRAPGSQPPRQPTAQPPAKPSAPETPKLAGFLDPDEP